MTLFTLKTLGWLGKLCNVNLLPITFNSSESSPVPPSLHVNVVSLIALVTVAVACDVAVPPGLIEGPIVNELEPSCI